MGVDTTRLGWTAATLEKNVAKYVKIRKKGRRGREGGGRGGRGKEIFNMAWGDRTP